MQFKELKSLMDTYPKTNDLIHHINVAHKFLDDQLDKVSYTDMVDNVMEIYLKTIAKLAWTRHNIKHAKHDLSKEEVFGSNLITEVYYLFNNNFSSADYGMFISEFMELITTFDTKESKFSNKFSKFNYMLEPNIFTYNTNEGLNTKISIPLDPNNRDIFMLPYYLEFKYLISKIGIKELIVVLTILASSRVKAIC